MRRLLLVLPLLLTSSCATNLLQRRPAAETPWRAVGQDPSWEVLIKGESIALYTRAGGGDRSWRYVRPRVRGDAMIWRSGHGNRGVTITARRAPCRLPGEAPGTALNYEHFVTVKVGRDGSEYYGCGGRIFAVSSGPPGR